MSPALGILCYHRIVQDGDASAWPYVERGTGVRAQTFEQHVADIARFAEVVSEDTALTIVTGRRQLTRPAVWITFDDGYRDIIGALPFLRHATVFVATCTSTRLLPADAWYEVLLAANRARGVIDLGLGPFDFDLGHKAGRARLVHGPERCNFLRAAETTQAATLRDLSRQLDADEAIARPYLTESDLRLVVSHGWSLGSHGVTHTPFDTLDPAAVQVEAAHSRQLLRSFGPIRSLALPDGARGHVDLLYTAGYECVLSLGNAPAGTGVVQPRLLAPDDPAWIAQTIEPMLTGDVDA